MRILILSLFLVSLPLNIAKPYEILFHSPTGGSPVSLLPDSAACWSDAVDLDGYGVSSEIIDQVGLDSEIANDFILDDTRTIALVRWWGTYW